MEWNLGQSCSAQAGAEAGVIRLVSYIQESIARRLAVWFLVISFVPCAILAMGSRTGGAVIYPESELAQRHRAGVATATPEPKEAYAGYAEDVATPFREGWLPGW